MQQERINKQQATMPLRFGLDPDLIGSKFGLISYVGGQEEVRRLGAVGLRAPQSLSGVRWATATRVRSPATGGQ